mmetsp:Transcript_44462/g.115041  ORF Transcript_44462/g.115041 Transcript_44462/m.115041 type:complete len:209 (-) Transcript_44462:745-1371(-)
MAASSATAQSARARRSSPAWRLRSMPGATCADPRTACTSSTLASPSATSASRARITRLTGSVQRALARGSGRASPKSRPLRHRRMPSMLRFRCRRRSRRLWPSRWCSSWPPACQRAPASRWRRRPLYLACWTRRRWRTCSRCTQVSMGRCHSSSFLGWRGSPGCQSLVAWLLPCCLVKTPWRARGETPTNTSASSVAVPAARSPMARR